MVPRASMTLAWDAAGSQVGTDGDDAVAAHEDVARGEVPDGWVDRDDGGTAQQQFAVSGGAGVSGHEVSFRRGKALSGR